MTEQHEWLGVHASDIGLDLAAGPDETVFWYYEIPYPHTYWQRLLCWFGLRKPRDGGFRWLKA